MSGSQFSKVIGTRCLGAINASVGLRHRAEHRFHKLQKTCNLTVCDLSFCAHRFLEVFYEIVGREFVDTKPSVFTVLNR